MDTGLTSIKDVIELISVLAAVAAVIWASLSYRLSHRQFMSSLTISCVERYHFILEKIASPAEEDRVFGARLYLELCNEELFYMENRYLPDPVIDEWLVGMVRTLHFSDEEGRDGKCELIAELESTTSMGIPVIKLAGDLSGYPRIQKVFCRPAMNVRHAEEERKVAEARMTLGIPRKRRAWYSP